METGIDRRGAMLHPWEGRPEDLPYDVAYAFTDDKLNANWRQLMEAMAQTLITGIMCVEGTVTYGASTTTQCRLTLPDGYTELNDYLIIGDGSRVWRVKVLVANEIAFGDLNLISGSGASDYNTIQDSLRIVTLSKEKIGIIITKNEISLGAFTDALHGDDIRISQAIATTIKDLYDDFYTEHESDGTHSDGIIGNSNLDKNDVLITQSFNNKVKNGAFNIKFAANLDYWTAVGSPVTLQANYNGKTSFPMFECQLATNDIGQGLYQDLYGFEPDIPIRMCVFVKGDSGGEEVKLQLYTGIETATNEITATSSWVIYYLTLTPTDCSTLIARIISNTAGAQTVRIALITIGQGDVHTYPERSAQDAVYDAVMTKHFYIHDLIAASDITYAKWVLDAGFKILRTDVKAKTKPDVAVTLRITDGTNDYDTVVSSSTGEGNNTADQVYLAGTMEMKVMTSAASFGGECILTVQYRVY